MLNEKIYNELSNVAYWLDSKHKDYAPEIKEGISQTIGGQKYEILQVMDNQQNGMQAMAVSPIDKNGHADKSQIIIAYAGTNSDDKLDVWTDTNTVIGGNKHTLTIPHFWTGPETVTGQAVTAQQFATALKKKYPNAYYVTTGHSLGEFLALYIAAENKWVNIGFNGPDPYQILSSEAKEWVAKHAHLLFNYRNKSDKIGNFGDNKTGAAMFFSVGKEGQGLLYYHHLTLWQFDPKTGKIKFKDSYYNKKGMLILAEKRQKFSLYNLSFITKGLKASGGGLSQNEHIYLEDRQALIAIESAALSIKAQLLEAVNIYQHAITEADQIWADIVKRARLIGDALSDSEVIDALASGGATKENVINGLTEFYQQKIDKIKQMDDEFASLATTIQTGIERFVAKDAELAQQVEVFAQLGLE